MNLKEGKEEIPPPQNGKIGKTGIFRQISGCMSKKILNCPTSSLAIEIFQLDRKKSHSAIPLADLHQLQIQN